MPRLQANVPWDKARYLYTIDEIQCELAMTSAAPSATSKPKTRARRQSRPPRPSIASTEPTSVHSAVLMEAKNSGLLDGEKSEHVSFRVPPALLDAAKRETGLASTSELGVLALALVAQPDPVAAFLRRTRGRLGKDHTLDV